MTASTQDFDYRTPQVAAHLKLVTADLSDADVEEIGRRLDAIRESIRTDLGEDDAAYIHRIIRVHRALELSARATLMASIFPPAWIAGTAMLSIAKILENMELGHNIMHGQWDWMRDPEIHSTTWEWDSAISSDDWKKSHNDMHHMWTNVIGKDKDVGYGRLRVTSDQEWKPEHLGQVGLNVLIALFFEYGIAMYDATMEAEKDLDAQGHPRLRALKKVWTKVKPQMFKDYVAFPLLSGISAPTTLTANFTANILRNLWTHTIIFCGHFPDNVEYFTEEEIEGETQGEWYIRQLMGSANIEGSELFHIMSGNLSHQIEHHLFPDLPSNRYAEIAPAVRAICEEYGLPYTSGRLSKQSYEVWRSLAVLSLPNEVISKFSVSA
ncbi:MAG TPA: acyl-CoA desaturase [Actinobacteria bacterium]|nr:acyl-CoA desaturase [Actinomycetota bacterium]